MWILIVYLRKREKEKEDQQPLGKKPHNPFPRSVAIGSNNFITFLRSSVREVIPHLKNGSAILEKPQHSSECMRKCLSLVERPRSLISIDSDIWRVYVSTNHQISVFFTATGTWITGSQQQRLVDSQIPHLSWPHSWCQEQYQYPIHSLLPSLSASAKWCFISFHLQLSSVLFLSRKLEKVADI